ncbi:unnamed protein product [Ceratitis capitata]|uniref:(Mediterranean fruit fly) hypothetical protein n=1 Tax=Ceratitis capitata TaxID=7213 RepID=A0A811UWV5_CERCA|nr:unnamed protein product [Ceratitis capitata]
MPQQLLADSHVTFALAVQRNGIDIGECGGGGCGKTANVNHSLNGVICDVVCVMVHQGSNTPPICDPAILQTYLKALESAHKHFDFIISS